MARLKDKYRNEAVAQLQKEGACANLLGVARLEKIVVNMGFGADAKESIERLAGDLAKITGQKPVLRKARKSISNFKVRKGMIVGAKVTLRGDRMYEFLDRLISAALPRIRDFRGLSPRSFDGRGSYSLGVKEQTIFPEIDANVAGPTQGMDITIVTTARTDEKARDLLRLLGMPFAAG
jgi:large subunit ribosomal protein L5